MELKKNSDDSDLSIAITLKAVVKNMRLRKTGYFQGEYLYSLSNEGHRMSYKEYGINNPKSVAASKNEKS